jgi:hypothetical protein
VGHRTQLVETKKKKKKKNRKVNQRDISSSLAPSLDQRASNSTTIAATEKQAKQALRYPTRSVIASSSQASMNPSSKAPSSKAKTTGSRSVSFIRPMRESKQLLLVLTPIAKTNEPFCGVRRPTGRGRPKESCI